MSIEIIGKPKDFCPDKCLHRALILNDTPIYADYNILDRVTSLVCDHEAVCQMWADKIPKVEEFENKGFWKVWTGFDDLIGGNILLIQCSKCDHYEKYYSPEIPDILPTRCPECHSLNDAVQNKL